MAKRDGQEVGEELQASADVAELVRQRSVEEMVKRRSRSDKRVQMEQRRNGRGRSEKLQSGGEDRIREDRMSDRW